METDLFDFELPPELIAAWPAPTRGDDRLLVVDRVQDCFLHHHFSDLPDFVRAGDVWVCNDARVRKARLEARKTSGGRVEVLLLEPRQGTAEWECLLQSSRPVRDRQVLQLPDGRQAELVARLERSVLLRFDPPLDEAAIEQLGNIPLPPYILKQRALHPELDEDRYQTVYARSSGAAAAPTAGLHFTPQLMEAVEAAGAQIVYLTLDVGWGTFAPVKSEQIEDHHMHGERYLIPEATARAVAQAKAAGQRVVAVGTTALRALEAAWTDDGLQTGPGHTGIFITPGYTFRVVDALLTNFHTPRSTLLMLVAALAGRERILAAYQEAVSRRYRFFSYGDGMLVV